MHEEHGHRGRGRSGGGGGGREGRGVPLADLDPALTEVSRKLIGCAIEVHKGLGPGFDEAIYQAALEHELRQMGVPFASHAKVAVKYRGQEVGHKSADLIIDNRFIVEMMASRGEIGGADRAALRALLRAADMELGLIINFAERRLKDGLVRVLNPDKLNLPKGDHHDDDAHDSGFSEMESESHA
ncbi:MAG: GxxExxY protein [Phycisphaeraceae bacterium]|nr:GxxExxY protein [Phycisphaeraceae bacterium]